MKTLTEKDINFILSNSKWRFKYSDIWNRYDVLLFPAFLLFIALSMPIGIGLTNFTICWAIIFLGFVVYFATYHYKRIQAEKKFYSIPVTSDQISNLEIYLRELNWLIVDKNSTYILARTKTSLTSWGEIITIIFKGNEVLFNSRPDVQSNTDSRDSVNFWAFYNLINTKGFSR
jgi:hypothetical protein